MYQHLLVTVQDNDASIQTIGHATEFARAIGARSTFPQVTPASDCVTDARRRQVDRHADEFLAKAEAGARARGVPWTCVVAAGDAPFDKMIAQARRHGCGLICADVDFPATGAFPPGSVRPAMLSAERTSGPRWRRRSARCRMHNRRSAARRVCANEKASLFNRLCERTWTLNAQIAGPERLHQRNEELLQELAPPVGQDPLRAPMREAFQKVASAYAQSVWEWMRREPGVVLTAVRRYPSGADSAAIDGECSSGTAGCPHL